MASTKPILYSYWRSSCSWRVRAALIYKQIPYECKTVDLIKNGGEQHSDQYKAVNPSEMVPTLNIDGLNLSQSLAILEYLDEKYPTHPILPKDPATKAKVRSMSLAIAADIQPIQNVAVLQQVGDKKVEFAKHFIRKGFVGLEKMLACSSGRYAFDDQITMADFCIVPQVYNAIRFGVDMTEFPTIQRINNNLMELDAFKSTHPARQPDTPEADRIN